MTIIQTLLVFVGIPLLAVLLITFAVFGKSLLLQPNRYRPMRGWNYEPRWFVAHPEVLGRSAVESGPTTAVGGASGEW